MERSEWPDDDALGNGAYPPAPLPPHERTWRHPSEIGRASWAHTEPPLTIGRGLLITTGAIGGLLSLAVLWAMLPSPGRGGSAAPTVVTSTLNEAPSPVITARPDTLVATSLELRLPPTTERTDPVATTAVPEQSSAPTTLAPSPQPTLNSEHAEQLQSAPVAVGIGDSLVITTARAVPSGHTLITFTGPDGRTHEATVVMVDRELGLAVLSADAAATNSYVIGPAAAAGDVVTVLGVLPTSANVSVDADGNLTLDSWADSMAEGTPVINSDGLLVAMCSHGESGPELVSVANVVAMLPAAKPATPDPWLGVHVVDNGQDAPTIDVVNTPGPAATAGIVTGDAITAVNGVPVGNVDELRVAIAAHVPGDVVTLTVLHADQSLTQVDVTLAAAPSM